VAKQGESFGRVRNFLCFSRALARPGDFRCLADGRYPLVVLRGRDGALPFFQRQFLDFVPAA
jgi:phenylpropionate dioxygenase-like ring-hydroxylating dioxygenase large terminal subunit